ncbi:unnamed protein product [Tenebrio molitor]|nr:unnamed protein product [Tenebrio molitor]
MGTFCQFVIYVGNIIDRTVSMISECSIKQDLDKSLYFGIRFQNTADAIIKLTLTLKSHSRGNTIHTAESSHLARW